MAMKKIAKVAIAAVAAATLLMAAAAFDFAMKAASNQRDETV